METDIQISRSRFLSVNLVLRFGEVYLDSYESMNTPNLLKNESSSHKLYCKILKFNIKNFISRFLIKKVLNISAFLSSYRNKSGT